MRLIRVKLSAVLIGLGLFSSILCTPGARGDETTVGGDASASGDGGGEITASVTVEYVTAGSGGDGGGVTSSSSESVTVNPICRYVPFVSPAELKGMMKRSKKQEPSDSEMSKVYPGYNEHKNDSEGRWYTRSCRTFYLGSRQGDPAVSQEQRDEDAREVAEFYANYPEDVIWVGAGSSPPAPRVSAGRLARAAWKAVKIPSPTVETNPKVGDRGATLVGMDTWVWATGETPTSVKATATAGSTSVTVTAGSSGLQLSAPDGKASCTGFGIAWHSGMPEGSSPCTISFNRSSAHLGGATPLTIKVAYSASYTATDGNSGTLPAITTTSTVNLPVAEVQTLTTNHNNPRQN